MKILLINNNPVVSRLTALSARKEDVEIDEIQEVTELKSDKYDIVFVDSDAWSQDVSDVISEHISTKKKVLFYAEGEDEEKKYFDVSILKPFLPSEVSAIIRSIEQDGAVSPKEELFDLDGLDDSKIDFDDKLEEAFPLSSRNLDDDLFEKKDSIDFDLEELSLETKELPRASKEISKEVPKEEELKFEDDLFDLNLKDTTTSFDDNPLESPAIKKEEFSALSLDDALVLEEDKPLKKEVEKKKETEVLETETKILDKSEIDNIKSILEDDGSSSDMTLDDLMPLAPSNVSELKEHEKSKEKKDENKKEKYEGLKEGEVREGEFNLLLDNLASMPVESLREILAGTEINIQIKFPKSK